MVNVKYVAQMVDELTMMKMFPARDESGRIGLVRMLCEMATEDSQVRWLITRMLNLYAEWPGAREMRACFCSRFRPADGISAYSTVYIDGIPCELKARQLTAGETKLLPAGDGEPVSSNPCVEAAVHIAVKILDRKNQAVSGPATAEEIRNAPEWLKRLEGYEV